MFNTITRFRRPRLFITMACLCSLILSGTFCNKDIIPQETSFQPHPIPFVNPVNFPQPFYDLAHNQVTEEGVALGRKLFYDTRLSADGSISCASCHKPGNAFSDMGNKFSKGVHGLLGNRNTTTIMNIAWNTSVFWDGRVTDLDQQPIQPIQNPVEMGEKISNIAEKLKLDGIYTSMFKKAFANGHIDSVNMLKALSQFMLQFISINSKFDKVQRQEGVSFTPDELYGFTFFKQVCRSCHASDLFTDHKFRKNGLPPGTPSDSGRYLITHDINDVFLFKTPSLRNIAVTAPYMHDGRFNTLHDVLEHYRTIGIGINQSEEAKLIAFLNTLTDSAFLNNPKLDDPK